MGHFFLRRLFQSHKGSFLPPLEIQSASQIESFRETIESRRHFKQTNEQRNPSFGEMLFFILRALAQKAGSVGLRNKKLAL